jgi:hypothetical protein
LLLVLEDGFEGDGEGAGDAKGKRQGGGVFAGLVFSQVHTNKKAVPAVSGNGNLSFKNLTGFSR